MEITKELFIMFFAIAEWHDKNGEYQEIVCWGTNQKQVIEKLINFKFPYCLTQWHCIEVWINKELYHKYSKGINVWKEILEKDTNYREWIK